MTEQNAPTTWIAWEKLRIFYNLVLCAEGVTILWPLYYVGDMFEGHFRLYHNLQEHRFVFEVVLFCVAANVCYFFGPIAEANARKFGVENTDRLRHLLFVAGLLLSMVVMAFVARQIWLEWFPDIRQFSAARH